MGNSAQLEEMGPAFALSVVTRTLEPGSAQGILPVSIGVCPENAASALCGELTAVSERPHSEWAQRAWMLCVPVTGKASDAHIWQTRDLRRNGIEPRRASVWGFTSYRPPRTALLDPRMYPYVTIEAPTLLTLERDRDQLWAEALDLHRRGFRPVVEHSANPWLDDWAKPVFLYCLEINRSGGHIFARSILRDVLRVGTDRLNVARLNRLMTLMFGAKRKSIPEKGQRYDIGR